MSANSAISENDFEKNAKTKKHVLEKYESDSSGSETVEE